MNEIVKYLLDMLESQDITSLEVAINCMEQELNEYVIEAYYEINIHNINLLNGELN